MGWQRAGNTVCGRCVLQQAHRCALGETGTEPAAGCSTDVVAASDEARTSMMEDRRAVRGRGHGRGLCDASCGRKGQIPYARLLQCAQDDDE